MSAELWASEFLDEMRKQADPAFDAREAAIRLTWLAAAVQKVRPVKSCSALLKPT
ncbi:MAG: hypothetical protein HY735_35340 [Verrucomicrobia bacterium]|nr:hypothetical protein [Verrucomicrobiota bacterium]